MIPFVFAVLLACGAALAETVSFELSDGAVMSGSCTVGEGCTVLGVPFAAPPVGPLRWKPPQPVPSGTPNLNANPPSCSQPPGTYDPQSEDCLYLNIFTPANATNASNLPVLVWFYGGGFLLGGINLPLYQGTSFVAEQPVILVTGVLGWGVASELANEDPHWQTSGNYGLLDQQAGLKWVKANIAKFGGDSTRVTIFGESAGAVSVCFQLIIPSSRNLFVSALTESGPCVQGATFPVLNFNYEKQKNITSQVMAAVDCTTFACMRSVNATKLVALTPGFPFYAHVLGWGPVIDRVLIPDDPIVLITADPKNNVNAKSIIAGSNTDEGTLFVTITNTTAAEYNDFLVTSFGAELAPRVAAQYPGSRFAEFGELKYAYAAARVSGDNWFTCPTRRWARLLEGSGINMRLFHYAHMPSWIVCPGPYCTSAQFLTCHSCELTFVFGQPQSFFSPAEKIMSSRIIRDWASLATSGVPQSNWPVYDSQTEPFLLINVTSNDAPFAIESHYRTADCDFWDHLTAMCDPPCANGICYPPARANDTASTCSCYAGWTSSACTVPICVPACDPSGGVCVQPNTCRCFDGYSGVTCADKSASSSPGVSRAAVIVLITLSVALVLGGYVRTLDRRLSFFG